MYGQYVPIITLVVSTFTLIEAAGASDDYPSLKGTSKVTISTNLFNKMKMSSCDPGPGHKQILLSGLSLIVITKS